MSGVDDREAAASQCSGTPIAIIPVDVRCAHQLVQEMVTDHVPC